MSLGSEPHLPRQIRLPSRRIDTAVSFIDTSRPTYSAIFVLRFPAPKPARSRDSPAAPSWSEEQQSAPRRLRHCRNDGATRSRDYPMWMWTPPTASACQRMNLAKIAKVAEVALNGYFGHCRSDWRLPW